MMTKISIACIIVGLLVIVFALVFLYSPQAQGGLVPLIVAGFIVGGGIWYAIYEELPK